MSYFVKEIFYSIQGEGFYSGRPAVFCRFAGCNLWSGKEADREKAVCKFCDTDFVGCDEPEGGQFPTPAELVGRIEKLWPKENIKSVRPLVVCTGGEPLLQLDIELISALHEKGWEVAVETNGTLLPPPGIDWICVSPKAGAKVIVEFGAGIKIGISAAGGGTGKICDAGFSAFFPAADGFT